MTPNDNETEATTNSTDDSLATSTDSLVSRRAALAVLGLSGVGVLGSGSAAADHETDHVYAKSVGTTSSDPGELELQVNDERVMRFIPTSQDAAANIVGGHPDNRAASGAESATILGGGGPTQKRHYIQGDYSTVAGGLANRIEGGVSTIVGGWRNSISARNATVTGGRLNQATNTFATVGGGRANQASAERSTVAGGEENLASGDYATIGAGRGNTASDQYATVGGGISNEAADYSSTVAGGQSNIANAVRATVGGGVNNEANAVYATVPGGRDNTADGFASFAAGREADTNGMDGTFVFGDQSSTPIQAQNQDEARFQVPIYAPSFNTTSARAAKTNVDPVDPQMALDGVESLEMSTWEFTDTDDGRHLGPMAEDFHDAFDLGSDDETIATVDADGVAFAAIQGLSKKLDEKDDRITDLKAENAELREEHSDLNEAHADLKEENAELREQYAELESRLDALEAQEREGYQT